MFRHMLMAGASRMVRNPENDEGHEDADAYDPALDDDFDGDADEGDEAGGEEDHLQDDDVGDDDGQEDGSAQVAPASRGANRIATLAAERAAANARAEAAEARLREVETRQSQQTQRETEAQERERLAMMDPEERAEYRIQQFEQRMEQRQRTIEFQAQDTNDKTSFEGLCARNPALAPLKDEVEEALKAMRANGTTAPRETVAYFLLGQKAAAKAPRAKAAGARAAAAGRERQQARPTNGRGDVPATGQRRGGSEAEQRRRRLENLEI